MLGEHAVAAEVGQARIEPVTLHAALCAAAFQFGAVDGGQLRPRCAAPFRRSQGAPSPGETQPWLGAGDRPIVEDAGRRQGRGPVSSTNRSQLCLSPRPPMGPLPRPGTPPRPAAPATAPEKRAGQAPGAASPSGRRSG